MLCLDSLVGLKLSHVTACQAPKQKIMTGLAAFSFQDLQIGGNHPVFLLEKTLESPLDCKEVQPVHPKGNQSWVFIGRTDAEAETPILWPPDAKN